MDNLQNTGLNLLMDIGQRIKSLPPEKLEKMVKALQQLANGSFDFLVIKNKELNEVGEGFFAQNPRNYIVVVGYTKVSGQKILGMAKQLGIPKDNVKLFLDYNNRGFPFETCENPNCVGVIVGPNAHKVIDMIGGNSPASELKERLEIPIIDLKQNGSPKLSKTNIRSALRTILVKITKLTS